MTSKAQTDQGFPHLRYSADLSAKKHGELHGEEFRQGIQELAMIRRELMLDKAPWLAPSLDQLAHEQLVKTEQFFKEGFNELQGLALGANLTLTDMVILNNYTDFRDIRLPDEGCSTLYYRRDQHSGAGQTWDMHGSAKRYLCTIEIEATVDHPAMVILSLVGCLGLMGYNSAELMLGVNNINTLGARPGVIWPALVRKVLHQTSFKAAQSVLFQAEVTSGHNYILADQNRGAHFEISPGLVEVALELNQTNGQIFHTNHCLAPEHKKIEDQLSSNSTTLDREAILKKRAPEVIDHQSLFKLLQDHENYPKSLCSHFVSNAQDPSLTCGGGVVSFDRGFVDFWRGCPKYDQNYSHRRFVLNQKSATFTNQPLNT
jgi:isopenicillin-N N-acyltransferase like protein